MHLMKSYKPLKGDVQNFSQNFNVPGQNKCCGSVSHKIFLLGKMLEGDLPLFEIFQLDRYANVVYYNRATDKARKSVITH